MDQSDGAANYSSPEADTLLEAVTLHSSTIDCKTSKEPNIIGPYKLLYRLGEGGMGQVWLAEQTEPVHRTVALKFIRIDMYDESANILVSEMDGKP